MVFTKTLRSNYFFNRLYRCCGNLLCHEDDHKLLSSDWAFVCYQLSYHFYADDTQLYLSFETSSPEDMSTCTSALQDCVKDIDL